MTSRRGGTLLRLIPLLLFGTAFGAVPEEAVYQWAADVEGVVSKETKAAPRAYLWLPPTTVKAKGLVLAQHNMLEEPIFAHPAFRAELAKADVGLVWITPMVMQTWDKLADAELAAMENVVRELGEKSGHPELGTVPLAPFGHSAMATYPYLFAAARPARTFCAVSIKGDWPEKGRPCWDAALVAAKAKVPMLLISGEYEDGYNRREKARDLMKEDPEATFSMWVDVGGGHFDWSDELCQGLGEWFAEMAGRCDELSGRRDVSSRQQGEYSSANAARRRVSQCVKSNGFWYPSAKLAKLVSDYEALPRGRGAFAVLGYEYEGKVIEQNPKAHLQVIFGTKEMTFKVKPVFETIVPPGRPETWTGKKAGEAVTAPRPEYPPAEGCLRSKSLEWCRAGTLSRAGTLVLQKIQGPVEYLGDDTWAVKYNRYDPRGYRSREASFQMVYSGSDGFKRSVQQGLVHIPWPKQEFTDAGTVPVTIRDFPLPIARGGGALASSATPPYAPHVREGPAVVLGHEIVLKDVPKRFKRPIDITVVTYDVARREQPVKTTYRLTAGARRFVHLGIDVSQADIDRARAFVSAGREPWAGSFAALKASPYSSLEAPVFDRGTSLVGGNCNGTIGIDGRRAHDLALLYRLTDDVRYAEKATAFLNANSHYETLDSRGTAPLDNGKIYLLVEAAELLRSYSGWAKADKIRFAKMLRDVFYPMIKDGDPTRFGNQGLFAYRGALAIAIFLEDECKYDRVWRYLNGLPHRADQEAYVSGPACVERLLDENAFQRTWAIHGRSDEISDYGYDEQLRYYIYANGQCQESSRDQGHVMAGLFQMVAIAEAFRLQGDDFYGALDNRLLTGLEWNLRYNFGAWTPRGFTDDEREATFDNGLFYRAHHRSGRWQSLAPNLDKPAFGGPGSPREAAYAHYLLDAKLPPERLVWLKKAIDQENAKNGGFETWGKSPNWMYEWSGWGTLMKRRL